MPGEDIRAKVFTHAKFNAPALLDLGSQIRGKACNCDLSQTPATGSLNWAITISFEDGMEWIFRSPRKYYGVNMKTAGSLIASEAATLKYIRRYSSIPVPEIFAFSSTEVNQIEVPFILMSKASGSALNAWDWNNLHCSKLSASHEKPRSRLTFMEKKKIMKQIGRITSQLSRLRFDYIGSIFEEEGTYKIKNCLSSAFSLYGRDKFRENIDRGPFTHEKEYYESLVSAFLLHVESLPLEHHIFLAPVPTPDEYNTYDDYRSATDRWNDFVTVGSKIDSGKNRLDYFIIGRLLQNMIPSLAKISDFKSSDDSAGFPLSHPDLSLSNIFVDDDCNITCVIDWAFTTSVPFAALLMTPGLPHPRDEMTSSLTTAFRNGFEEDQHSCSKTYKTETGSSYTMWDQCRNIWLFTRLINMDSLQDVRHFTQLYTSISGEADINVPILLEMIKTQGEFSRKALSLMADDQPSSDIEREEMEYFSHVGLKRLALSRKLTLVSNMSEGFLANGRLWRWLAKAVGSEDD